LVGREADAVPNGSFAEGTDGLPRDWELIAGEIGASTQWLEIPLTEMNFLRQSSKREWRLVSMIKN